MYVCMYWWQRMPQISAILRNSPQNICSSCAETCNTPGSQTKTNEAGRATVHPVSITRFLLRRFSPGAGLLRNVFVHRVVAKIFQGLGPKRRESSNGDRVYAMVHVQVLLPVQPPAFQASVLFQVKLVLLQVNILNVGSLNYVQTALWMVCNRLLWYGRGATKSTWLAKFP